MKEKNNQNTFQVYWNSLLIILPIIPKYLISRSGSLSVVRTIMYEEFSHKKIMRLSSYLTNILHNNKSFELDLCATIG